MAGSALPTQAIRLVLEAAAAFVGVDPSLIKAIAWVESNWKPRAQSPVGARGLMQLMPSVCTDQGVTDVVDPAQNVIAGARHIRAQLKRFGNLKLALAAYNWGPRNVAEKHVKGGGELPATVEDYCSKVLARLELERVSQPLVTIAGCTLTRCVLCGRDTRHCSPNAPQEGNT